MTERDSIRATQPMAFDSALAALLDHRRVVLGIPIVLSVIVVALTLILPRTWTVTAAFTPQTKASDLGRLAGLAAQLGVGVAGQDPGQQPAFYAELLQSTTLLRLTVDSPLALTSGGAARTVLLRDQIGGRSADPQVRSERAVEKLRRWVGVSSAMKTGIVTLSIRTRHRELSQAIAVRLLGEVDHFNRQTRQSQARQERQFLAGRLTDARDSLRAAEDSTQAFLQRNRVFSNSPQLTFERNRLERRTSERQQIVTTLAQAFEQSRIDEVRDTPLITVLQYPTLPAVPDRRLIAFKALLAFLGGLGLSVLLVLWRESAGRALASLPDGGESLRGKWSETVAGLRRHVRRLFRLESGDL